jgi:tryptophan synthase beta chain
VKKGGFLMDLKIHLSEKEMPRQWYNIVADLPTPPPPPLDPVTGGPLDPSVLLKIFPRALIEQEMSTERWIDIPDEIIEVYRLWRPTPLMRARNLEKALKTPARIYYKWEGVSPAGSHKPNTAVAQAYYNKIEGVKRLTTETGAGQWGSALAMGCKFMGIDCTVYMVKVSYYQKPYRRVLMQLWGAEVYPSPSDKTESGRKVLEENPDSPGSLGIAISEAVEDAFKHEDTNYSLGSVLNHVLLHQTIIGLEARKQFEMIGEWPDVVAGCIGGGSNFAGLTFPFLMDKLQGKRDIRAVAVEPSACPSVTKGIYTYDYGDVAGLTPLLKMFTLGHNFIPSPIHAGGLRYHGMAPLVSLLYKEKIIEAVAYPQRAVFEAGVLFAQTEGYIPAPETAHVIKFVVDEAIRCREEGKEEVILFNGSGHGHFDMAAYDDYLAGKLEDFVYPEEKVEEAIRQLREFLKSIGREE